MEERAGTSAPTQQASTADASAHLDGPLAGEQPQLGGVAADELEKPAAPEAFGGEELETPAVPEAFARQVDAQPLPPAPGTPSPAAVRPVAPPPTVALPAAPRVGRPVEPGNPGAPKRLREKLRRATTREKVVAAVDYGHRAAVPDLLAEVQRIADERVAAARGKAAKDAAKEWGSWALEAARNGPTAEADAAAAPAPDGEAIPAAEASEVPADDGAPAPEPKPQPAKPAGPLYYGQPVAKVAAWAEVLAPYVEAFADYTRGTKLDLTREVDVTVMAGTPYVKRIQGDVKGRITSLAAAVAAEHFSLGGGSEDGEEAEESPSAFWELAAIGTGLGLALVPSPLETLQAGAKVFIRGAVGAGRLVRGLFSSRGGRKGAR